MAVFRLFRRFNFFSAGPLLISAFFAEEAASLVFRGQALQVLKETYLSYALVPTYYFKHLPATNMQHSSML